MDNVLKISEAASLALHAAALLGEAPEKMLSTREIASILHVSEAHLSKVLQRLSKTGIVRAIRGPRGGFMLEGNPEDITLLRIYEEIEGPLPENHCLLGAPVCNGNDCILGGLLEKVNKEVREYLSSTKLSELKDVYKQRRRKNE